MSAIGMGGKSIANVCSLLAISGLKDPSNDIPGICWQKLLPGTRCGSTLVNGGGSQSEGGDI